MKKLKLSALVALALAGGQAGTAFAQTSNPQGYVMGITPRLVEKVVHEEICHDFQGKLGCAIQTKIAVVDEGMNVVVRYAGTNIAIPYSKDMKDKLPKVGTYLDLVIKSSGDITSKHVVIHEKTLANLKAAKAKDLAVEVQKVVQAQIDRDMSKLTNGLTYDEHIAKYGQLSADLFKNAYKDPHLVDLKPEQPASFNIPQSKSLSSFDEHGFFHAALDAFAQVRIEDIKKEDSDLILVAGAGPMSLGMSAAVKTPSSTSKHLHPAQADVVAYPITLGQPKVEFLTQDMAEASFNDFRIKPAVRPVAKPVIAEPPAPTKEAAFEAPVKVEIAVPLPVTSEPIYSFEHADKPVEAPEVEPMVTPALPVFEIEEELAKPEKSFVEIPQPEYVEVTESFSSVVAVEAQSPDEAYFELPEAEEPVAAIITEREYSTLDTLKRFSEAGKVYFEQEALKHDYIKIAVKVDLSQYDVEGLNIIFDSTASFDFYSSDTSLANQTVLASHFPVKIVRTVKSAGKTMQVQDAFQTYIEVPQAQIPANAIPGYFIVDGERIDTFLWQR